MLRLTSTNPRAFLSAVAKSDAATKQALAAASKAAAEKVADQSKSAAGALGGVAAKSAPSIRAIGGAAKAAVTLRKAGGYEFGAEFGSLRFKQFLPWRGNGKGAGYFLTPTVDKMQPDIAKELGEARAKIIDRALGGLD